MTEDTDAARHELDADRRVEARLLWKGLLVLVLVAAFAVVRHFLLT